MPAVKKIFHINMVYHVSVDLTRKFIEVSEHFDGSNGGLVENLCIFLGEFLYV